MFNWGNFRAYSNIRFGKKILKLQKCLARIVGGASRQSHADPLFHKLSFLKINDLYQQSVRMFSFQLFNNILPDEIAKFFPKAAHDHMTRSVKNNLFVERADPRSMKFVVPRCWNSLPLEMKKPMSTTAFKTMSKKSFLGSGPGGDRRGR